MTNALEPALMEMLGRGGFEPDYAADLEAVTRLMLVASVSLGAALGASSSAAGWLGPPTCLPARLHSVAARLA